MTDAYETIEQELNQSQIDQLKLSLYRLSLEQVLRQRGSGEGDDCFGDTINRVISTISATAPSISKTLPAQLQEAINEFRSEVREMLR